MTDNPLLEMGQRAKQASYRLLELGSAEKNALLATISAQLKAHEEAILAANAEDMIHAEQAGLSGAMLDRLLLTPERLDAICADLDTVIALADPIGEDIESTLMENGMRLARRRIPLGVLGVIYEARPNVTVDVAVLALKTGNAAIMRGGKETLRSNKALMRAIHAALAERNLPRDAIQLIESPDRAFVTALLQLDSHVDMVIPRGGAGLHQLCKEQARMPVITGGIGICHMYVEQSADLKRVLDLIENAKVQRPTVCNSMETLLVDEAIAASLLPQVAKRLHPFAVTLKACPKAKAILGEHAEAAGADDFDQEWLSLVLGIKVVADLNEAIAHIRAHSSEHSDSVITEDRRVAERFIAAINSAAVYVNASTRFTDGSQFGLGAEVAVSTQKLHARGPMGLEALTTYKWIGMGDYHFRR